MKTSTEEVSAVERRLTVEVDPTHVDQELDKAYRALSRRVVIRGFRPGKVPRRILEQQFREEVESDVRKHLVEETLPQALKERGLTPVASPQVRLEALKAGTAFRYQAHVELKPRVEVKDYRGLPLKPVVPEVAGPQVDEELQRLRQAASQLVPVTDRDKVMEGDYAVVDFLGSVDGAPFKGGKGEAVTVEVSPGEFVSGHAAQLAGAKVGEQREVRQTFAGDHAIATLRGKTAKFAVTVKGIKTREAPTLDDELAKDMGAKDLADLRERVKTELTKRAKVEAERAERDALVKTLADRNPFDIPQGMVDEAVKNVIAAGADRLARAGVDMTKVQLDVPRLREEMKDKAAFTVRSMLLLEAVARQEKLDPTDEEIEARIAEFAKETGQAVEKLRPKLDRDAVRLRLLEEKAVAFLKSHADTSGAK